MKITHLFIYPFLAVLALACGPSASDNGSGPMGSGIDTTATPGTAAYAIQVLDAEKPSPRKEMKGKIGNTEITVNYGSPSVRNREIWDGLVPYDKVWRAGANEATTIQFSGNVTIEGKPLAAGRYGFFSIPGKEKWTLIFNSVPDQWGAFDYDATKDVFRTEVTPQANNENAEQLDYLIAGNSVVLRWEKLSVSFTVQTAQ